MKKLSLLISLVYCAVGQNLLIKAATAQVTPDGTTNTSVNVDGNNFTIEQGDRAGDNLFHSFGEFSVPTDGSALFNNSADIVNIFSRVTGGNISNIDGLLGANGTANLFLINPAGILFGDNASLSLGGSFYGSTADSILFPDGEFSATDIQQPILTINAPIGLNFRDNPGEIVNRSFAFDDTGENRIGLAVAADETLALIGGNISIEGGFITTQGGRIELGSVAQNSTVNISPGEKGFSFGYEGVADFRDISLSAGSSVTGGGANGDITVRGKNVSLIEESALSAVAFSGQIGDINIIASESLTLDGSVISNQVFGDATGEGNRIDIDTPKLTMTNFATIGGANNGEGSQGVDVNINASEITAQTSLIIAQVFPQGTGDGGNITVNTEKLTLNEGAQISTDTFRSGNGGDVVVNASESIELDGTTLDPENNIIPSSIRASVGIPFFPINSSGNGGNVTINTSRLVVSEGAQIQSTAQNNGSGGNVTIAVTDSILLTGTSPSAQLGGDGRSGISVSAEPSYEEFITNFETGEETLTGEIIPTTGNGGSLTLSANNLTIQDGAFISADTFSFGGAGDAKINVNQLILRDGGRISSSSFLGVEGLDTERGAGGNLDITATESVEITGIGDINGEPVESGLFTLAESDGVAGNTILNTSQLNISNGGEIDASANNLGIAGNVRATADEINLNGGRISASTNAGDGGNLTLNIAGNLSLRNNSSISAAAMNDANGGNVNINSQFITAFPSSTGDGNDILANASAGRGGNINIDAESLFGIEQTEATPQNGTNDIDASSEFSFDGTVDIDSSDINPVRGATELPQNIITPEGTITQACRADREIAASNNLTILGKGGIPPTPEVPLSSQNILIDGETNSQSAIPQPIETSQGKIQLARGIKVTESGEIILTPYRTNNSGERIPEASLNCDRLTKTKQEVLKTYKAVKTDRD